MAKNTELRSDDRKIAFALYGRGRCARQTVFFGEAEELLQRALDIFEARLGRDDLSVAIALGQQPWSECPRR